MQKEYIIEMRIKAKVQSDCSMRAAGKVAKWVLGVRRRGQPWKSLPPFEILDWGVHR